MLTQIFLSLYFEDIVCSSGSFDGWLRKGLGCWKGRYPGSFVDEFWGFGGDIKLVCSLLVVGGLKLSWPQFKPQLFVVLATIIGLLRRQIVIFMVVWDVQVQGFDMGINPKMRFFGVGRNWLSVFKGILPGERIHWTIIFYYKMDK